MRLGSLSILKLLCGMFKLKVPASRTDVSMAMPTSLAKATAGLGRGGAVTGDSLC